MMETTCVYNRYEAEKLSITVLALIQYPLFTVETLADGCELYGRCYRSFRKNEEPHKVKVSTFVLMHFIYKKATHYLQTIICLIETIFVR